MVNCGFQPLVIDFVTFHKNICPGRLVRGGKSPAEPETGYRRAFVFIIYNCYKNFKSDDLKNQMNEMS
jgi:hypothetical protein